MKGGNYMIKKFGFTLAEVLITLGIIGVVAAMTIPTLMQRTNDAELKSGYKKMISVVSQAISMNYALDGVDFSEISGQGNTTDEKGLSWLGFLYNRLNVVGSGTIDANTPNGVFFSDGSWMEIPSTDMCDTADKCPVLIDVNGKKGPNKMTPAKDADADTATIYDRYTVYAYKRQFSPTDADTDTGNFILKN